MIILIEDNMNDNITHIDILIRQEETEKVIQQLTYEVQALKENTKDIISAFNAASGAFKVLEWLAKITKPILFLIGIIGTGYIWFKGGNV